MTIVRALVPADIAAVTRIYAQDVLNGTGTFEEIPPSSGEMRRRAETIAAARLPWLVADTGGAVVGYSYAAQFHIRSAYRYTLEDAVYIDSAYRSRGVGRALLGELIARCEALGYRQMIARIGDSANRGSIALHKALGFENMGFYQSAGLKFGRWLDVVLMQRALGAGADTVPPGDPVSGGA
ncbi:MAG: N-acetyltransferase [Rhodomicrobium sp.]|nr:N-acetyltransferase [Rhodomicrobium sp.]